MGEETFKLRSRVEYEKLVNTPVYTTASIRIKFPNELLIQANFAIMETIGDIYAFLRENLENPNQEFYLTTTPPLVKYLDMKATILKEKLAPSTLMYINFPNVTDYNVPFLTREAFEKYSTKLI
jgi:hypothetical protein